MTKKRFHSITAALCDINGIYRGKRLPASQLDKVFSGALRMPLSVPTVDIWGRDIEGNILVFEAGDADGICLPFTEAPMASPWLDDASGFLPVSMYNESGAPHLADPRHALAAIVARFQKKGLRPVVATELEFYLNHACDTQQRHNFSEGQVLSVQELERVSPFLQDVYACCEEQGIPADAAISECGPGQFEINLLHRDDPLRAADDAVFFKRLIKGFANKHGYNATFMAKPDGTSAGSGLHVHCSLLDGNNHNVFDDGSEQGSDTLRSAVAGLIHAMQQCTLIFAPHMNSYRRIKPDSHAPTSVAWGYENRTAAIRIPGGSPAARRVEHRVAGADANPYLVLAVLLGAMLEGINNNMPAPTPITGNAYNAGMTQLPLDWSSAITAFEQGDMIETIFDPLLKQLMVQTKRQEFTRFLETVSEFEYQTYKDTV